MEVLKRIPGLPKIPTDGHPVNYKGGRIYFSKTKSSFRAIRLLPFYNTERQFQLSKFEGNAEQAFLHACKSVSDYKP